ncbi:zinc ribbon domain-containing protein YjdM [Hymenobacter sp. HD11105]
MWSYDSKVVGPQLFNDTSAHAIISKKLPMDVKDSNGTLLSEGDSVTIIKDLKVKGASLTLKRGTMVKNIRLTNSDKEIEGRAGGSTMVLKTEFLKKA